METDWSNPESRAALLERVGVTEYNRLHGEHLKNSLVTTAGGHEIRAVSSQFGKLYHVGKTPAAFAKLEDAEAFANSFPVTPSLLTQASNMADLDGAINLIQRALKIQTGDVAGQFFAGKETVWAKADPWNRLALLGEWLKAECFYAGRAG